MHNKEKSKDVKVFLIKNRVALCKNCIYDKPRSKAKTLIIFINQFTPLIITYGSIVLVRLLNVT